MPGIVPALALTVMLATHAAGASPVAIGLRATYVMQCSWPGPQVDVVFPSAERLPPRFAKASVLVDGKPPASVTRTGSTVSLRIARPSGVMCDVMGPGTVRIAFTRSARICNPLHPGRYVVRVAHGASTAHAAFTVS